MGRGGRWPIVSAMLVAGFDSGLAGSIGVSRSCCGQLVHVWGFYGVSSACYSHMSGTPVNQGAKGAGEKKEGSVKSLCH